MITPRAIFIPGYNFNFMYSSSFLEGKHKQPKEKL